MADDDVEFVYLLIEVPNTDDKVHRAVTTLSNIGLGPCARVTPETMRDGLYERIVELRLQREN